MSFEALLLAFLLCIIVAATTINRIRRMLMLRRQRKDLVIARQRKMSDESIRRLKRDHAFERRDFTDAFALLRKDEPDS